MSLPKIYSPIEPVSIAGETFELRCLTRADAARCQKMLEDGAPKDELEIFVIAAATETALDEVRTWYGDTPGYVVEELIEHISRISRLHEGASKSGGEGDRPGG